MYPPSSIAVCPVCTPPDQPQCKIDSSYPTVHTPPFQKIIGIPFYPPPSIAVCLTLQKTSSILNSKRKLQILLLCQHSLLLLVPCKIYHLRKIIYDSGFIAFVHKFNILWGRGYFITWMLKFYYYVNIYWNGKCCCLFLAKYITCRKSFMIPGLYPIVQVYDFIRKGIFHMLNVEKSWLSLSGVYNIIVELSCQKKSDEEPFILD